MDNSPKKFTLSKKLQSVLGVEEDTRARIVAALWQYIKSNRLQDAEDRRFINLNHELSEVFDGLERIEFHQIIGFLKQHLVPCQPLTLSFKIDRAEP